MAETEKLEIPKAEFAVTSPSNLNSEKPSLFKCLTCEKEYFRPEALDAKGECYVCRQQAKPNRDAFFLAMDAYKKNIPMLYQRARMDDLSPALVAKFAELPEWRGLCLWGGPGVGKSHAMAAIAFHFAERGIEVCRVKYESLCMQIRGTYRDGSKASDADILRRYTTPPVLILEDIGTTVGIERQESDFSLRVLYMILDDRIEAMKPTFITTNKSVEELGKSFDARIASRILQACSIIKVDGRDRRKEMAK